MFSGCKDEQTSADVYDVSSFGLPEDAGPGGAGGACTNALMSVVCEGQSCSWISMLSQMRSVLEVCNLPVPMQSDRATRFPEMLLNCRRRGSRRFHN